MSTTQRIESNSPYWLDSQDYWAGHRGTTSPPAPSFRKVRGRQRLGRYLDPFGCQALMDDQKRKWEGFYTGFFISAGSGVVFCGVSILAMCVLAPWYLTKRAIVRRRYDRFYHIQQEIERTGKPQWVPYDRHRLKLIDFYPNAVWP